MLIGALSNIRSLFNVGSIFRTADALGVDRLILGGYTGYPPRKEIAKTALGAQQWVAWERAWNLPKRLRELKHEGFIIVGLENNIPGTTALENFSIPASLVLVVGNEMRGLSPAVKKEVDSVVAIPMKGKKESLNVAVAFGIAAYYVTMRHSFSLDRRGGGFV